MCVIVTFCYRMDCSKKEWDKRQLLQDAKEVQNMMKVFFTMRAGKSWNWCTMSCGIPIFGLFSKLYYARANSEAIPVLFRKLELMTYRDAFQPVYSMILRENFLAIDIIRTHTHKRSTEECICKKKIFTIPWKHAKCLHNVNIVFYKYQYNRLPQESQNTLTPFLLLWASINNENNLKK